MDNYGEKRGPNSFIVVFSSRNLGLPRPMFQRISHPPGRECQEILEVEKNKNKLPDRKSQELFKKSKEEPISKPLKDIDLD